METINGEKSFKSIDDAWDYSNDLGSKWFFFPFHFVIKGQTIKDSPTLLKGLNNKRIKTVQQLFKHLSNQKEFQNLDVFDFAMAVKFHIKG